MSAKPDALYRMQIVDLYRDDRRRIVDMLSNGEVGLEDGIKSMLIPSTMGCSLTAR
jgi:hypothetical protein